MSSHRAACSITVEHYYEHVYENILNGQLGFNNIVTVSFNFNKLLIHDCNEIDRQPISLRYIFLSLWRTNNFPANFIIPIWHQFVIIESHFEHSPENSRKMFQERNLLHESSWHLLNGKKQPHLAKLIRASLELKSRIIIRGKIGRCLQEATRLVSCWGLQSSYNISNVVTRELYSPKCLVQCTWKEFIRIIDQNMWYPLHC